MSWSPGGPAVDTLTRQGWTVDGPDPVGVESRKGWFWVPQAAALDDAGAQDLALVRPALVGRGAGAGGDSLYMGTDPTQDFELRIPIRDNAGAQGLAVVRARETGRDDAAAGDLARLGVIGRDSGAAGDLATARLATSARDNAVLGDLAAVRPRQSVRDAGGGGDSATAVFSATAAVTTTFSTVGTSTYTIPVWCSWLDVVLVAGGGGGKGAGWGLDGYGGKRGEWLTVRLVRGVDIPWTLTLLSITIGDGGAAGVGGASPGNGGNGSPTTATASGVGTLTAAGGAGGTQNGPSNRTGEAAGNTTFQGVTYTGGGTNSGVPGSGGQGGASFGGNGVKAARGQAWVRAGQ